LPESVGAKSHSRSTEQADPIGYGDRLNWYNYVGSDPINFIDPSGLEHVCGIFNTGGHDLQWDPEAKVWAVLVVRQRMCWDTGSGTPTHVSGPQVGDKDGRGTANNGDHHCTAVQIAAQKVGERVGALGVGASKVGSVVQKGGAVVGLGSAALLQPEGVLIGGEIVGWGTAVKTGGRLAALAGYGLAMAGGGDARREFNDLAVRSIPLSGIFPGMREGARGLLNRAEDAVGVPHNGCRR